MGSNLSNTDFFLYDINGIFLDNLNKVIRNELSEKKDIENISQSVIKARDIRLKRNKYPIKRIIVAFSGGVDSSVALYLAKMSYNILKIPVIALHVNHQHKKDLTKEWEEHARLFAKEQGIDFCCRNLKNYPPKGESIEGFLRDARYNIFRGFMKEGDVIVLGHHQDDQAETVLLQLFRGAGINGLSAMPSIKKLGKGILWRPFLNIKKSSLYLYAKNKGLKHIEDITNKGVDVNRNYLRNEIIPLIKTRWPQVSKSISTSAFWLSESLEKDGVDTSGIKSLSALFLKKLSHEEQKNWIRSFVSKKTGKALSMKKIQIIQSDFLNTSIDKHPLLNHNGYTIHREKDDIFITNDLKALDCTSILVGNNTSYLEGMITLRWDRLSGISKSKYPKVQLKPLIMRSKVMLYGDRHRRVIKKIFQDKGVPFYLRHLYPGIYSEADELLGILGVGITKKAYEYGGDCYLPLWQIPDNFAKI